jgi:hypothetical protein
MEHRRSGLLGVPGYMDINTPSHTLMKAFSVFVFLDIKVIFRPIVRNAGGGTVVRFGGSPDGAFADGGIGGAGIVGGASKCTLRDGAGVATTLRSGARVATTLRGGRVAVGGICDVNASG